jgi:putative phosphoribosyl transferase
MFENRQEAGQRLAAALDRFAAEAPVVLALPRGGVPVALEVARRLKAPLGLAMVRKIGAPGQPELAIGAVADGPHPVTVLNEDVVAGLYVDKSYIEQETKRQLDEIERRRKLYTPHLQPAESKDKTVILVDDGIATGATVRAAARSVRAAGAKRTIIATPVASPDVVEMLKAEADEVISLETPDWLGAIGLFYRDFRQVSDEEVSDMLDEARRSSFDADDRS